MHWCFYSLVGFVVLFTHHRVLANELELGPLAQNTHVESEALPTRLLLPMQDLLSVREPDSRDSPQQRERQKSLGSPSTVYTFFHLWSPSSLGLPAVVDELVNPLLSHLTTRDPLSPPLVRSTEPPALSLRPPKQNTPLPRVDRVWKVSPVETWEQDLERSPLDRKIDLGMEVHAGTTKKDQTTNAIKGTASSQFTLLPLGILESRFGRYLDMLGKDKKSAILQNIQFGVTTNGAYTLNPHTKAITSFGEVVGSLNWTPVAPKRFTRDPWRIVAFRVLPSFSWEGRSLLGEDKKQATANKLPLDTLTGILHGDLRLDFLSPQLAASGEYQYRQQLADAQMKWELASVSLKYQLNSQVSLSGSFTQGQKAPNQPAEHGLELKVGVTF